MHPFLQDAPLPPPPPIAPFAAAAREQDDEEDDQRSFKWSAENELILVEWGDVAKCYEWMHAQSHRKYAKIHTCLSIPVIVLSTFSGTASFAQSSLPSSLQAYSPMVIGSLSILIGVLGTLQQYLKVAELKEGYRVSAMAWGKFARNVELELSKKAVERADADVFFKIYREKFDRLTEASALIPSDIVHKFVAAFSGKPGSPERASFEQLAKPAICMQVIRSCQTKRILAPALAPAPAPSVDNPLVVAAV